MQQLAFNYPISPGFKNPTTSREAAVEIAPRTETLRDMAYQVLKAKAMSADEVAEWLEVDRLSVRPRISELVELGRVFDTGMRSTNRSGRKAIIWGAK